MSFLNLKNHKLITPLDTINNFDQKFDYECACGEIRNRSYANIKCSKDFKENDYLPKCCKLKSNIWYVNNNNNEHYDEKLNEKWIKYKELWFSNKGNIINKNGNPQISDEDNNLKYNDRIYNQCSILAELFKINNYEKLKFKNEYIAIFGLDEERVLDNKKDKNIDNIIIIKIQDFNKSLNNEDFKTKDSSDSLRENADITDNKIIDTRSEDLHNEEIKEKEVDELKDYILYNNGCIIRKQYNKKGEKLVSFLDKNNNIVLRTKNDRYFRVDKLMIYAFKPVEGKNSYIDYEDIEVKHIDNNYKNNHVSNLEVTEKNITIAKRHKLNVEKRLKNLRDDVLNYIQKFNGKLITNIEDINTVRCKFKYICKCNVEYERTMKNLRDRNEDQKCLTCIRSERYDSTVDEKLNYVTDQGETFIKTELCYVSNKGNIQSCDKRKTLIIRDDNCVKINGTLYNVKVLIAKAFKIEYYEFLEDKNYFVKTKDKSNDFNVDNLYVWSFSKENWDNIPNSKQYYNFTRDRYRYNYSDDKKDIEYKEFLGKKFYKDGSFEKENNTFSNGCFSSNNDYLQITIDKTYKVHRIICFLFNPIQNFNNFDDYNHLVCNHINGIKNDNRSENLEWITPSENTVHAIQTGLVNYCKSINLFKKLKDGSKGEFIKKCVSITEASIETKHSKDYIKKLATLKEKQIDKNKKTEYWFEFDL